MREHRGFIVVGRQTRVVARYAACMLPVVVGIGITCAINGCTTRDDSPASSFRQANTELTATEHFQKAFELVRSLDEFDPDQTMAQVAYHLNCWLTEQQSEQNWQRDALVDDPALGSLRRLPSLVRLDKGEVTVRDVLYLRENRWLRDIATWVPDQPPPWELAGWLQKQASELPAVEARRLASAVKLFDWTVRHIQLDALADWPTAAEGRLPAEDAVPGPGYTMAPWENLLLGHGDAWQRARVFMLLLRQQAIPSVLLARQVPDGKVPEVPWAVGVLIAGQLYLFDPALGLALPGPGGEGIATLGQVSADPQLLRHLDVSESLKYPVTEQDLSRLVALVDASSEALSRRMKLIESQLAGEHRLVLTVAPSQIAEQVRGTPGIGQVRLWRIPLEAELFALAYQNKRAQDSRLDAQYQTERFMFSGLSPLAQARQLHFQRRFEKQPGQPSAVERYMEVRHPEAQVAALEQDFTLQKQYGLQQRPGEPVELWQNRIRNGQMMLRAARYHASYFLGLLHYDNGDYESAANWFRKRTLEDSPQSPWLAGARYNLARAEEARGNFQIARQYYLLDESPQRHGNLLRARWIRLHAPAQSSEAGDSQASSP
jgi:tetratricopeptide (TPR) repeat protein